MHQIQEDRFGGVETRLRVELARYRLTLVEVNGFTDTSGTSEHNQRLSEDRAYAVADELARDGVDRRRIQAQGYGESRLAVPTPDGVREPRNRRVEIVLEAPRRSGRLPTPQRDGARYR